ncbi:MAG: hypothetical protein WBB07_12055, partial [Mycobacterium sp.]
VPAMSGLPMPGALGGGLPGAGGGSPGGAGWSPDGTPVSGRGAEIPRQDLEDLLAAADAALSDEAPATEDDTGQSESEPDEAETEQDPEPQPMPESAEVRLPNGDLITAPNPQLAQVINAALSGTPIGEAFHRNGLTIPPPGSPVDSPVDPKDVATGDVGMFTDRQALALDRTRALLAGEIQPLASVSGPSFLGWMHPPSPSDSGPATAPAAESPAPTRPATTPAN